MHLNETNICMEIVPETRRNFIDYYFSRIKKKEEEKNSYEKK